MVFQVDAAQSESVNGDSKAGAEDIHPNPFIYSAISRKANIDASISIQIRGSFSRRAL